VTREDWIDQFAAEVLKLQPHASCDFARALGDANYVPEINPRHLARRVLSTGTAAPVGVRQMKEAPAAKLRPRGEYQSPKETGPEGVPTTLPPTADPTPL
jgi:hypothetical protein